MISNTSSFTRTTLFIQVFDAYGEVSRIINRCNSINSDTHILYNLQYSLKNFWDAQNNMSMRNVMRLQTINENIDNIMGLYKKISCKNKIFDSLDIIMDRINELTEKINYIETKD